MNLNFYVDDLYTIKNRDDDQISKGTNYKFVFT
jgi:hypothetical protein